MHHKNKNQKLARGTITPSGDRPRAGFRIRGSLVRCWERKDISLLAIRDYQLKPYPGNATLFIAQDEPGSGTGARERMGGQVSGCV